MIKSVIKREQLNLPKEQDYGIHMVLGLKKSKIITLNLE